VFEYRWKDMANTNALVAVTCAPSAFQEAQQKVFVLTPKLGEPVVLHARVGQGKLAYFGFHTVEELE
jgi:hypothetical protein